jgi:hypothetical protein
MKTESTYNADELAERVFRGASPHVMAHLYSAGTRTVMRPDTLRTHAHGAGFSDIEILPIENDTWRFYKLV